MVIGIPGWVIGNMFGINLDYYQYIMRLRCGDLRILTLDSPIYSDLDLLIIPGGADVNPERYGGKPGFYTGAPDLIKEYFDLHILPQYIEQRTPIFGICRGVQTIAVHFGLGLVQDMSHETNGKDDPYAGVHGLRILDAPNRKIKVNSRHHQSIEYPSDDSPVRVLATHSANHRHVEAIRIQGYPICGVQYHPENLDSQQGVNYSIELIESIIRK